MFLPQLLYGGFKFGQWLFGSGGGGSQRVDYTLFAVPPDELDEFAEANAPACLVPRFCELLRENGYPTSEVDECRRSAAAMERRFPGHVIVVGRVREQ